MGFTFRKYFLWLRDHIGVTITVFLFPWNEHKKSHVKFKNDIILQPAPSTAPSLSQSSSQTVCCSQPVVFISSSARVPQFYIQNEAPEPSSCSSEPSDQDVHNHPQRWKSTQEKARRRGWACVPVGWDNGDPSFLPFAFFRARRFFTWGVPSVLLLRPSILNVSLLRRQGGGGGASPFSGGTFQIQPLGEEWGGETEQGYGGGLVRWEGGGLWRQLESLFTQR